MWGTVTAKSPDPHKILDYYWGGPERRISALTVRIIGINALMLVVLLISVFFLGEYQNTLLDARLGKVEAEARLILAALSTEDTKDESAIRSMVKRLSAQTTQRIIVFGQNREIIADSYALNSKQAAIRSDFDDELISIRILRTMVLGVLDVLIERKKLPVYRHPASNMANDFPFVVDAFEGEGNVSVWHSVNEEIILSAALPLKHNDRLGGAVLLIHTAHDLEKEIDAAWITMLRVFCIALVFVVFWSIYFSGVITRPLKKLARAAEGVRKGKLSVDDIPDFTERKDEIGELSVSLRQMTKALSDRMGAIEAFAADVAHELKNPLTSLRSAVETLEIIKKKTDREKLFSIVRHDIERLNRLITDIAHISKLDTALSRDQLLPVNISALARRLLDAHKAPLERNATAGNVFKIDGVTVVLHIPFSDLTVWGHEGRLEQVLQNLLTNALSFSPPTGQIDIRITPNKDIVRVDIEDQGPGIPQGSLDSVFERFYSSRPDHEEYGMHSGLGLSICKQIVEAFGGQIYAENRSDQGARFTVILRKV